MKTILDKKIVKRERDRFQSFFVLKGQYFEMVCFRIRSYPERWFGIHKKSICRDLLHFISFGILGEHSKILVSYSFGNLKYFWRILIRQIFSVYSETISRKKTALNSSYSLSTHNFLWTMMYSPLTTKYFWRILRIWLNTFRIFSEYAEILIRILRKIEKGIIFWFRKKKKTGRYEQNNLALQSL